MANNVRKLRVARLLTPSQLAMRMRADASDVERLESPGYELAPEWIEAVAKALGVPAEIVVAPDIDIGAIRASAPEAIPGPPVCPIATRYAILALVAKFAGVKFAAGLDDDSLARAAQNFFNFVEGEPGKDVADDFNRQKLALQIAVLTILQARGFRPRGNFEAEFHPALDAALDMMRRFADAGSGQADG
ncbi:MAG: helix-turn-helix transcriptional regulator [Parvularculaceae bacterium]|nr:helix-turn-helix transcriptional regulator [Parvularculaceae bacterium]